MKISDFILGVRELWAFIWPPVVLLVIVVGMANYLAPQSVISVLTPGWKGLTTVVNTVRPHLEALGLSALVPLVGPFVAVFVLYALRSIVFSVGQVIPPVLCIEPICWWLDILRTRNCPFSGQSTVEAQASIVSLI